MLGSPRARQIFRLGALAGGSAVLLGAVVAWWVWPRGTAEHPAAAAAVPGGPVRAGPVDAAARAAPASLGQALAAAGEVRRAAGLYRLAVASDRRAIEKLLGELRSLDRVSQRRTAGAVLYARFAELDGDAALDHLLAEPLSFQPEWLTALFGAWAVADLPAAVARVPTLDADARLGAVSAILSSRDDLPAPERRAIAERFSLQGVHERQELERDLALGLEDPEATLAETLAIENHRDRRQHLYALMYRWGSLDPVGALAALPPGLNAQLRSDLQSVVVDRWALRDVAAALAWVLEQPPSPSRLTLAGSVLRLMAREQPERALSVASTFDGVARASLISNVLAAWSAVDPRSAAHWAAAAGEPAAWSSFYAVASAYAEQHPDEARAWALSLPPARADMALSAVVQRLASTEPVTGAALTEAIGGLTLRHNASLVLVTDWARDDPVAAARWSASVEVSEQRRGLYQRIMEVWGTHDPPGAAAYLARIGDPGDRDAAAAALVSAVVTDVEMAERVYAGIASADARRTAAQTLWHHWRRVDVDRAALYRADAGISDAPGPQAANDLEVNLSF